MLPQPSSARPSTYRAHNPVRHLDYLEALPLCKTYNIFTPSSDEIRVLIDRARDEIPFKASIEVIQRVAAANPDSFWALRRTNRAAGSALRGFVAFLMLNQQGYDALLDGTLDTGNPPEKFLVGQHERPAVIYSWAFHARHATPAVSLIMEKLQSPIYRTVDLIARGATDEGAAFLHSVGFKTVTAPSGEEFYVYHRDVGRPLAHLAVSQNYANQPATNRPTTRITTVQTFEQFAKAMSIRSAVYVGEEQCPFAEEFDGNDFSGTQILAEIADEPVGCLRIRYFANFAKLERLAVRPEFRNLGVGRQIVEYAKTICKLKGYTKVCVHARNDKVVFWSGFGFSPSEKPAFVFSDYLYREMISETSDEGAGIDLKIDPYILLRPEGFWESPGILEKSAIRKARI